MCCLRWRRGLVYSFSRHNWSIFKYKNLPKATMSYLISEAILDLENINLTYDAKSDFIT